MSNKGQLIVVAAPSGAGKTSLVNALVERDPRLFLSVSFTTRAPRRGEEDGRDYHFTTAAEFDRMREAGEFLECAEVFGHWYGTHAGKTGELLGMGLDVILEIDWQGARQVRKSFPACHSVFILPPSLEALRTRLGRRGQDSEEVIAARMAEAQSEISHCPEFEYAIVNDDFDTALDELDGLIDGWRRGAAPAPADHDQLLAELLRKS